MSWKLKSRRSVQTGLRAAWALAAVATITACPAAHPPETRQLVATVTSGWLEVDLEEGESGRCRVEPGKAELRPDTAELSVELSAAGLTCDPPWLGDLLRDAQLLDPANHRTYRVSIRPFGEPGTATRASIELRGTAGRAAVTRYAGGPDGSWTVEVAALREDFGMPHRSYPLGEDEVRLGRHLYFGFEMKLESAAESP